MMVRRLIIGATITMGLAAAAPLSPPALPPDPRIRIIDYSPNQVVELGVGLGYAAVVELGTDERADSVVVGNSTGWQVTTTHRGDSVVVKPLPGAAATDMVVVTGTRRYVFLLQPANAIDTSLYVVRFTYRDIAPDAADRVQPVATFKFHGAHELFPAAMHDDGKRTIVTWSEGALLPAIFAITKDGREAIVNGRMVDGDYVVEATAPRFVFRLGNAEAFAVRRVVKRK